MKLKYFPVSMIIIILVFGGIFITSITGYWKTVNDKIPAKYEDGEYKGQYNPSDIRGSYTFGEISEIFEIPLEDLARAFNIIATEGYQEFKCKDLEALYLEYLDESKEVGTNSVRIFVALYKSLPIELDDNTYFPDTVESVLNSKGNLSDEEKNYIKSHLVESIEPSNVEVGEENNNEPTGEKLEIKGSTTFKEVLDSGIEKEKLEEIVAGKIDNETDIIKDYCENNGMEFSNVKENIQKLID